MSGLEPLLIAAAIGGGGAAAAGATGLTLAAAVGVSALAGQQLAVSGAQKSLDLATIEANKEQAKLQAAESALSNAQGFRKALASQLSLASFRGGPGSSIAAQFGAESMANFAADQRAIERGVQQINTAATIQSAGASLNAQSRNLSIIGGVANSALALANFSKGGTS